MSANCSPPTVVPMRSAGGAGEDYLSRKEAGSYLGISNSHLAALACRGGGPTMVKFGSRLVKYRRSDLDAWAASRLRRSTSEATVAAARGEAA